MYRSDGNMMSPQWAVSYLLYVSMCVTVDMCHIMCCEQLPEEPRLRTGGKRKGLRGKKGLF